MERAVTFCNWQGQRLFGILHLPATATPRSRIGVSVLNPGLKNRVAPNRINVRIARMLCDQGYPVLRFDPAGIGDSEGELAGDNELTMDLWGMIQRGAFVPDTLAANEFFVREARLEQLVLVGQCGGAVTAMLAAAMDERVRGGILVDLPVRLVSSKLDMADLWMDIRTPDDLIREYLRKVFSVRSWLNLVRGRSDYAAVKKLISRKFKPRLGTCQPAAAGVSGVSGVSDRFLWPLREAADILRAREARLSFIFAEQDFAVGEFSQDLLPFLKGGGGVLPPGVEMHVVEHANHIYTEERWQEALLGHIARFVLDKAANPLPSPATGPGPAEPAPPPNA